MRDVCVCVKKTECTYIRKGEDTSKETIYNFFFSQISKT